MTKSTDTYIYNNAEVRKHRGGYINRSTSITDSMISALKDKYTCFFSDTVWSRCGYGIVNRPYTGRNAYGLVSRPYTGSNPYGVRSRPYISDDKNYYDYDISSAASTVKCMGRHDECATCGTVIYKDIIPCGHDTVLKNVTKLRGIDIKYVRRNSDTISKYKVCTTSNSGDAHSGIGKVHILNPGEICTETYTVLYVCDDADEAAVIYEYLSSDVVSDLIRVMRVSQNKPRGIYCLVPMPDIHDSNDVLRSASDIVREVEETMGL